LEDVVNAIVNEYLMNVGAAGMGIRGDGAVWEGGLGFEGEEQEDEGDTRAVRYCDEPPREDLVLCSSQLFSQDRDPRDDDLVQLSPST
jgi:hypothetical protein